MNKEIQKGIVELRELTPIQENNEMRLSGIASVYESPTVLWTDESGTEYKEVIKRGAFDEADFSKCCLKYNHSDSVPVLARVRGGSLQLTVDDVGLKFEANLFNTSVSRDMYELVKQGGVDKCSFAFTIREDSYDRETHTRTIIKIDKVFDVSIVDVPAYDDTEVSARSKFFEVEAEKELKEALENAENEKRKQLLLKLLK